MNMDTHWVGTWAAAPAPSEAGVGFNNHTLRMNPRISIGGDTVRVRVSNAYGVVPLQLVPPPLAFEMKARRSSPAPRAR